MATKSNIRSMRFSNEILAMIEEQPGDTFTAKFEWLVMRCIKELPAKEAELAKYTRWIQEERDKYKRLAEKARTYEQALNNMKWDMQNLARKIEQAAKGDKP